MSRTARWCVAVGAITITALVPATVSAAPGDLDPTFGTGGILIGAGGSGDVAVQSDGKLVAAAGNQIQRRNPDGTPDASFGGGDGSAPTGISANSVELLPGGKIVLSGTHGTGESEEELAVSRLNSDGTPDDSFGGGDGIAMADLETSVTNYSGSLAVLPGGTVVVGGRAHVLDDSGEFEEWFPHFVLAGFNSDGTPASGFGEGGIAIGPRGNLYGLAATPEGKLLVAGRAGSADFSVARLNADGSLDTSFAGDGLVSLDLSPTGSQANDVLVQPDGKIVAVGFGYLYAVARFNSDGTPDEDFGGGDGLIYSSFDLPGGGLGSAIAAALQPDGRIVFAGQWNPDENTMDDEWAIARLHSNGAPDGSFGDSGIRTIDVAGGGSYNFASGVAIQSDGKIVASGSTGVPDFDMAMLRLEGGGSPAPQYASLKITKAGTGSGSVSDDRGPLSCGVNCAENYFEGETVTLDAFAEFGSEFTGWSTSSGNPGTCTGTTTPCEVTMAAAVKLVAHFGSEAPVTHSLKVGTAGSGSGVVTSSPAGISCAGLCQEAFPAGTVITLTATPDHGSVFTGWSGAGCFGTGSCTLTLNGDSSVTANFAAQSSGGGGSETVVPPPAAVTPPSILPPPLAQKPKPKAKPLKCRKGFRKQKVKGKVRCVRKKTKRR